MTYGAGGLWRSIKAFWISLRESFLQRRETLDHAVRRHFRAGVKAINEERWADAEAAFSRVLSHKATHFLSHLYLGVAVYHQGRHKEAHAALVRAQRIDPKRFAVYRASSALPSADPPAETQGDLLRNIVKNLEQCAHNLRETAEKIHDASRLQQRAIRRSHGSEPRRGLASGGRRRRGRGRKPRARKSRVSVFSSPEEAKKFRDMPLITKDDATDVDWDEILSRILE
jgi:tetratricopeptide (TPR) repeat protein